LRDDELIRRFCDHRDHRDRGDRERARELWEQLAITSFDRVQQLVKAFRFPGGEPLAVDDIAPRGVQLPGGHGALDSTRSAA